MMDITKFIERKRKELSSNNSTQEEASLKKPQEENTNEDSLSSETNDVFSQGLKSPECVKILFNCFQNLETEMKSIKEISLAGKDCQIKGTEQHNDTNTAINFINKKFEDFEKTLKEKEEEIKLLEKENDYSNKRLDKMDAVVYRQEQYSRHNCLLVHRIVEETVEIQTKRSSAHYNKAWMKQLNLRILIDPTGLASSSPPKMPNLIQ